MMRTATTFAVLLCLLVGLLALSLWAGRRTHNAADFVLASRRLGPWLVSLGYAGGAANAWMLVLAGAAAFSWGLSAVWIGAALVLGCIVNLWFVAPRLRAMSLGQGSVTLIQLLGADAGDRLQPTVVRSAVLIALAMLGLQVAIALRLAGALLFEGFGFAPANVILLSLAVVTASVFVGGLRAVVAGDAAQTAIVACVVLFLPVPALVASGGAAEIIAAFASLGPSTTDWFSAKHGVAALAFALGVLGLAPAMSGQPQVLNRLMAAKDETALRIARWLAPGWVAVLSGAVLLCGWCARVLYAGLERPEHVLAVIAQRLLPPWLSTAIVLALAGAIVVSVGGALLVMATSLAADIKRATAPLSMAWLRAALVGAAILACSLALYASSGVLEHAMFAVTALGAAFGPLLLVRLSGKRIRPGSTLGAMWAGFVLSLLFHLLPDSPGDFLERVLPFTFAAGIALSGGERRRNPDRADRAQETVHDRVPI